VKRQERYSNIHFIEANNVLDSNPNIEGKKYNKSSGATG
jgi:hypothetical protein